MQQSQLTPLHTFWRGAVMVMQAAPLELRILILLALIGGVKPATVLFLNKIIIDEATRIITTGVTTNINFISSQPRLWGSIAGVLLINLLTDSLGTISNFVLTSLRDRVQGFVERQVLHKVANYEAIELFENPELLNLVQLTTKGVQRLKQLSTIITTTLVGVFMLVPTILLSGSIAWWIPLILFSTAAPSVYVELKYRKQAWKAERTQATIAREMDLYKNMLMGETFAKELRLFDLQSLLLERWQALFNNVFQGMQTVRRQGTVAVIGWSIFSGLGAAFPYIYVVRGALGGAYTVGDLALYAGLILQVRQSLSNLISSGAEVYDVILGTTPIFQLLDLQPSTAGVQTREMTLPMVGNHSSKIEISNLSFCYPGSDKLTLADINLTIKQNEMIVLVGENGAGKTTLAKLLCRLYAPTRGGILWDGQDIQGWDVQQLHSQIAVVMQDYARFPTTVRENVSFGYLPGLDDDEAVRDAIAQAGISKVVEQMPAGLSTILGKQLEGGVDLSGGQWQRIAIARSLMRLGSAQLLIFDEPTAALDPKTEHEIYNIFREIAQDRMAVVVSHRLALAKQADKIVVLEHGKIIETGTHDELMALGGQYYLMFTRQAGSYK